MSRIIIALIAACSIGASSALGDNQNDIFEPDPETLWQAAQASEGLVYIDGVPSIVTTSANNPQSAAMANILVYLNDREDNPWQTGIESMDLFVNSLGIELNSYLEEHGYPDEMTEEEKGAVEIRIALLTEEAGQIINDLMEEDDHEIDKRHITELDDWITLAEGKAEVDVYSAADIGLRYAYILGQNNNFESSDLQVLSDALKDFMMERLYYDVEVVINQEPSFGQYSTSIEGNMPPLIKIGNQFMAGVGYWSDNNNDYIIVHDPLSSEIGIDIFNDDALPLDHVGDSEGDIIPGCQFILVGDATEDMELLIIEQWEFDFSDLLDMLELE